MLHLKANQLFDMLIAVFGGFEVEEDIAWVLEGKGLLAASYLFRHWHEM